MSLSFLEQFYRVQPNESLKSGFDLLFKGTNNNAIHQK
jgi:hypothetical protein